MLSPCLCVWRCVQVYVCMNFIVQDQLSHYPFCIGQLVLKRPLCALNYGPHSAQVGLPCHFVEEECVSGLHIIPRYLKQCDACILSKHPKQYFHDYNSKACRKLELIHFDLCGPMLIASTNGNKQLMYFIDDYTKMCQAYLLTHKYESFETFKKLHVWIENEAQFVGIMQNNILLMNLKNIFIKMGLSIKQPFHI